CNWNNPDEVAACANLIWEKRDYKADVEAEAYRNLAYLANLQWHKWNPDRRRMERDESRDRSEIRLSLNQIGIALEHKLAKLIRGNSPWDPTPGSTDDMDRAVARVAKDVMGWYYTDGLKMPRVMREAIVLAMCTKTCFLEGYWDPHAGDDV